MENSINVASQDLIGKFRSKEDLYKRRMLDWNVTKHYLNLYRPVLFTSLQEMSNYIFKRYYVWIEICKKIFLNFASIGILET